jgi:thiamine-phosphate pyrophosphorylase
MRGLYAITPESGDLRTLVDQVCEALAGGASVVQYRNKRGAPDLMRVQAEALCAVVRNARAMFIVNDNIDLAFAVDADGVHIGKEDADMDTIVAIRQRQMRRSIATRNQPFVIGVSCYNELQRAEAAVAAGADYVAFGSFFPSRTKPNAAVADVGIIGTAKARFTVPVVAIGGITIENAPQLISAKVDAVAVISDLFEATDIRNRARQFTNLFSSGNHVRQ